jgi:dienelactone hydrolase
MPRVLPTVAAVLICLPAPWAAKSESLAELDATVLPEETRTRARQMIADDIERRRLAQIAKENDAWRQIGSRHGWEQFRDQRISALRASLGDSARPPEDLKIDVTRRITGEGFKIENLVFQSRPGLFVTANLYTPEPARDSMPGILISHSHHNPKHEGELQDMGMIWARQGCAVLVMDHLGHGERRQHPFARDADFEGSFRRGRQDYYFRYNVGLQLGLVGESLMGWMAWDLSRGVDLLVSRPGIDPERIILIGAVAGGGDPAGVAAALDPRIACVVPFNFGGPQPDYAIPDDAEDTFYYFGVAYWEQTRCLRLGGRDGFAHWVIAGSIAPRRLIYAHEFGWDRDRDPVWPRLEKVFSLFDKRDHLGFATGRGTLKGKAPASSHCNNVGAFHRRSIHPQFERWFGIAPPESEYSERLPSTDLTCLSPELIARIELSPVHQLASAVARSKLQPSRRQLAALDPLARRKQIRNHWAQILSAPEPADKSKATRVRTRRFDGGNRVDYLRLETEPGITVPLLLLLPAKASRDSPSPVVVVVSESGKEDLLAARHAEFAKLLDANFAICLPDLRGSGETRPGSSIGRGSTMTTLSCRYQVLGETLVGARLRDLRSTLSFLRSRPEIGDKIALWGDSLAPANPPGRSEIVPHAADHPNVQSQPGGGLLVMLAALFEDDIDLVYNRGSFASFGSLLDSPFLFAPHASIIPGALTHSDIPDIAAVLAPLPLRLSDCIDGLNRTLDPTQVAQAFLPATVSYRAASASDQLDLDPGGSAAEWIIKQISK